MEKLSQIKSKFLKFLPKQPVASVAFQNPNMSPTTNVAGSRWCRSPALNVSIIPREARRSHRRSGSFSSKEPTSPKVSCMGQVQCKKIKRKAQKQKSVQQPTTKLSDSVPCPEKKEKILLWVFKGSGERPKQGGKAIVLEQKASSAKEKVPSLGTMKKFASGRESLCDFDFKLAEG